MRAFSREQTFQGPSIWGSLGCVVMDIVSWQFLPLLTVYFLVYYFRSGEAGLCDDRNEAQTRAMAELDSSCAELPRVTRSSHVFILCIWKITCNPKSWKYPTQRHTHAARAAFAVCQDQIGTTARAGINNNKCGLFSQQASNHRTAVIKNCTRLGCRSSVCSRVAFASGGCLPIPMPPLPLPVTVSLALLIWPNNVFTLGKPNRRPLPGSDGMCSLVLGFSDALGADLDGMFWKVVKFRKQSR